MQNALTRAPQELPNVDEVVKAYTINGAYTMRQEAVTGSLELNKFADLIVVDQDIFTIPTNTIATTKVILTLLAGKEVYKSATTDLGCPLLLPLTFLSFDGKLNDKKTVLNWKTTNEINCSHFEIERSLDGKEFAKIGKIVAANNPNTTNNYDFIDLNLPHVYNIYYRLKQIDNDGKFAYSNLLNFSNKLYENKLIIFPNPSQNEITISGFSGTYELKIFNNLGILVMIKNSVKNGEKINIENISIGQYFIEITNNKKITKSSKFIKQ